MSRARVAIAIVASALVLGGVVVVAARRSEELPPCGAGFVRSGARCCPTKASGVEPSPNTCADVPGAPCPPPLVSREGGCDAPLDDVVDVPATTVVVGPSDWEAEGRVSARTVNVAPFAMDRFEVSVGQACASALLAPSLRCEEATDRVRAVAYVPLDGARAFCRSRGGRLPTEDEWLAAAGGDRPRRYPWGDTGAVCRRAAWGLESGPCFVGGRGPDTVGAHPEGATPLGIHDLAGNVAEWVEVPCEAGQACPAVVRGGSWKTRLATELRTWLRHEVSAELARNGDATIGFRCVYDRAR